MSGKTSVLLPLALLVAFACNEITGPAVEEAAVSAHAIRQPVHVQWNRADGPVRFLTDKPGSALDIFERTDVYASYTGSELPVTEASFWAVRGEDRGVRIDYVTNAGVVRPYLLFQVPAAALSNGPDGSALAPGDSVLITVSVDTLAMVVHMEPAGLVFDPFTPAALWMWYAGAAGDLNGDGVVDGYDDYIEQNALGVWTQPDPWEPWVPLATDIDVAEQRVLTAVDHFSGFAISW